MTELTLTKTIDSTHLDLPELRPWLGKEVEIRITEREPALPIPDGLVLPENWNELPVKWRNFWILSNRRPFDDSAYRAADALEWEVAKREAMAIDGVST